MIVYRDGAYSITFPPTYTIDAVLSFRCSLIEVLKMASVSGIYDGSGNYLFDVLDLLQMMELTPQQINELVKQDRETLFHE